MESDETMPDSENREHGQQTPPWSYEEIRWFGYRIWRSLVVQGERGRRANGDVLRNRNSAGMLQALRRNACHQRSGPEHDGCGFWNPASSTHMQVSSCDSCPRPLCTQPRLAGILFPRGGGDPKGALYGPERDSSLDPSDIHRLLTGETTLKLSTVKRVARHAHAAGLLEDESLETVLEELTQQQRIHSTMVRVRRTFDDNWSKGRLRGQALCLTWLDPVSPFRRTRWRADTDVVGTIPPGDLGEGWFCAMHPRVHWRGCGQGSFLVRWRADELLLFTAAVNKYPCPIDQAPAGTPRQLAFRLVMRPLGGSQRHKNTTTAS